MPWGSGPGRCRVTSDSAHELCVIIPVLNRPHRIVPVVSSIIHSVPHAQVIIVPSANVEETFDMHDAMIEAMDISDLVEVRPYRDIQPTCGNYAKKINWAMKEWSDAEWIFTGADDLYFHPGWWEATERLREVSTVGVIGTNDLGHPRVYLYGETSTHSLVRFDYAWDYGLIDEPKSGKILHEGYVHEFVDDELVGTAKYRGAWVFCPQAYVEHLHPVWQKAPWDTTYEDQERRMNESRALYTQRCPLWGGTPI
jgi:glycosyltransferase involved in cell wall biosynthesis